MRLSRSWTSRSRRPGEPGEAYTFVSRDEFKEGIAAGRFLEWAEFNGNLYGTPVLEVGGSGSVVLEIDSQGARSIREWDQGALIVALVPPSLEVLAERMAGRGDSAVHIAARIEIAESELADLRKIADVMVVNDSLERATDQVVAVVRSRLSGSGDAAPARLE